jgi:hypothetical protein
MTLSFVLLRRSELKIASHDCQVACSIKPVEKKPENIVKSLPYNHLALWKFLWMN